MNLGKLLGVGKSFFGGDPSVAYRVNKRACLPKFNDGKNPFSSKGTEPESAPAAKAVPATPAAPVAPVVPVAPKAEVPVVQSHGLTIAQAVAKAKKTAARLSNKPADQPVFTPTPRLARPGWTTRLNPFRPPEQVAPLQVPQQAELSLDSVKVMHNDLADADVEIVPVKSHNEPPAPPVLPPARQAWEYLGENMLKSS